jgi:hypothetical protein
VAVVVLTLVSPQALPEDLVVVDAAATITAIAEWRQEVRILAVVAVVLVAQQALLAMEVLMAVLVF